MITIEYEYDARDIADVNPRDFERGLNQAILAEWPGCTDHSVAVAGTFALKKGLQREHLCTNTHHRRNL